MIQGQGQKLNDSVKIQDASYNLIAFYKIVSWVIMRPVLQAHHCYQKYVSWRLNFGPFNAQYQKNYYNGRREYLTHPVNCFLWGERVSFIAIMWSIWTRPPSFLLKTRNYCSLRWKGSHRLFKPIERANLFLMKSDLVKWVISELSQWRTFIF